VFDFLRPAATIYLSVLLLTNQESLLFGLTVAAALADVLHLTLNNPNRS
jgi:hypothetical protein